MLYLANEDYKLTCYDSTKVPVSLDACTPVCFTPQLAQKLKIDNKYVLTGLTIAVTTATGSITTSKINGTSVTFVSATATLVGNSEKTKIDNLPICLADETATILTLETSKCTKGKLTVTGVTTSSPPSPVVDVCDIWFSNGGQNKVKGD